jgi:enamine deaminase RidA (YjgF/YER057c/UK114 family)
MVRFLESRKIGETSHHQPKDINQMSNRQLITSGSPWEPKMGYSRAVKVGNIVHVSGTTSSSPDGVKGINDPREQTRVILEIIEKALAEAGATLKDVVRTRIYVTDISRWQEVADAHGATFGEIRPATAIVEVSKLINPDMMVEIEAEAIIGSGA